MLPWALRLRRGGRVSTWNKADSPRKRFAELGLRQNTERNKTEKPLLQKAVCLAGVTARQDRLIETLSPEQKELFDHANED